MIDFVCVPYGLRTDKGCKGSGIVRLRKQDGFGRELVRYRARLDIKWRINLEVAFALLHKHRLVLDESLSFAHTIRGKSVLRGGSGRRIGVWRGRGKGIAWVCSRHPRTAPSGQFGGQLDLRLSLLGRPAGLATGARDGQRGEHQRAGREGRHLFVVVGKALAGDVRRGGPGRFACEKPR